MSDIKPSEDRNPHLPGRQRPQVHHRVTAALAHKYTPGGRVLDVGCGWGYTLYQLWRLRPDLELHGADMDEACLRRTRDRVPDVVTIRMQPDRFDTDSLGASYDTCILSHVLEHLSHPREAVHRLLAVLRPGGHLVLVVPNPLRPTIMLTSMLRMRMVNPGHLQAWDRSHWMNFLENWIDAEVVEYASDEVRIFPGRWKQRLRPLEELHVGLAKVLPWWSFSNMAVIRRPESEG